MYPPLRVAPERKKRFVHGGAAYPCRDEAWYAQIRGYEVAERLTCNNCKKTNGPFQGCVLLARKWDDEEPNQPVNTLGNACANCFYDYRPSKAESCSLRVRCTYHSNKSLSGNPICWFFSSLDKNEDAAAIARLDAARLRSQNAAVLEAYPVAPGPPPPGPPGPPGPADYSPAAQTRAFVIIGKRIGFVQLGGNEVAPTQNQVDQALLVLFRALGPQ